MRAWEVLRKSLREQKRDLLMLLLTVSLAPLMLLLYRVLFPSGSTTYTVLVVDNGDATAAAAVAAAIEGITYPDGAPLLRARIVDSMAVAEPLLRDRQAAAFVALPAGFAAALATSDGGGGGSAEVTIGGDLTNSFYTIAVTLATTAVDGYVAQLTGYEAPVRYVERPLGASAARTEFEGYVPGLLIFAAISLMFLSSMALAREVEAGTLRRLRLTRMRAVDLLVGTAAAQMLVGLLAIVLTFLTAAALGFRSQGPLWVAVLVGALTALSVIGVGLMVACLCRTVTQAFIIANFPFAIFMFLSGAAYPVPRMLPFTVAGRVVGLNDVLPPTHAVVALNKVLTLGAQFEDVTYELAMLLVLSLAYLAIGVVLFRRRHMQA
ncbi:MAG: ABC transporter permease [Anaerolineae bacterium]